MVNRALHGHEREDSIDMILFVLSHILLISTGERAHGTSTV